MNSAPAGETIGILVILTAVFGAITLAAIVISGRVALAAISAGQARERQLGGMLLALKGVHVRHERTPNAHGTVEDTVLDPSNLVDALRETVETHGIPEDPEEAEHRAEEEMKAELAGQDWAPFVTRRPPGADA